MDKVNFICLLTLALFVTSTFSQKNQGYRNKYNLINCGCEKKIIFMCFEKKSFSELMKNLSDVPKSETFFYFTKITVVTRVVFSWNL